MKCEVIRDLIPLYIDGCLSDESIVLLEEHLEHCDACRALLELMHKAEPVKEEKMPVSSEGIKGVSLWKASILQAILQLVSFLLIVIGVTMEASDNAVENGFWATGLIVPATAFMLSLVNWYFVRLYRDRTRFFIATAVFDFILTCAGYIWAVVHYEFSFSESFTDFGLGFVYGIPLSIVLCVLSAFFADKYGLLAGKERMKLSQPPDPKRFTMLASLYCAVNAFTPVSIMLCAAVGYTFDIRSDILWSFLLFAVCGVLVLLMLRHEGEEASKAVRVLLTASSFMALLNWLVFLFTGTGNQNGVHDTILLGLLMGMFALSVFVSVRFIKPHKGRAVKAIIKAVILGVLVWGVLFLSFIAIIFAGIGKNTIVQTAISPSGRYTAEMVDSNQGALGGDTLVYVTDNLRCADFWLVTIHKEKKLIYRGEWGEFKNMSVRWVNEDTLSIGGRQYNINDIE